MLRPELWGLTTLQQHGAGVGERGREGMALEPSAPKSPFSKHQFPGEQYASAPRLLHHHRKARPRQTSIFIIIAYQMTSMRETTYLNK